MFSIAHGIFHIFHTLGKKSEIFENSDIFDKRLNVTVRVFMIQYGNRVVDVEWVIKLNKHGVSEKSIVKLLKLIILGTVNLLIWYGYFL